QKDGYDANVQADERKTPKCFCFRFGCDECHRDFHIEWNSVAGEDAHGVGFPFCPGVLDVDGCPAKTRNLCRGCHGEWHDRFVDDNGGHGQSFRPGVLDQQCDISSVEVISFNRQVFDRDGRFEFESTTGLEEKEYDPDEENDWEEKQDKGTERETVRRLRGSLVRHDQSSPSLRAGLRTSRSSRVRQTQSRGRGTCTCQDIYR